MIFNVQVQHNYPGTILVKFAELQVCSVYIQMKEKQRNMTRIGISHTNNVMCTLTNEQNTPKGVKHTDQKFNSLPNISGQFQIFH